MKKTSCIALMSMMIAMAGCAVDSVDSQEEEPTVGTIESEVDNPVRLNIYGNPGGVWRWSISNVSNSWACRRVVFVNGGIGVNRWVGPVLWSLLLWQAHRLRMAKHNCGNALILFRRVGLIDTCVGFVLYCLRWKYWPSFGAHMYSHPLDDIQGQSNSAWAQASFFSTQHPRNNRRS